MLLIAEADEGAACTARLRRVQQLDATHLSSWSFARV